MALIATARYFGAGWVIAEWNSIKEFERDNKPSKVELVKADSPRCEELMGYIRGEKRQGSISGLRIRLTVTSLTVLFALLLLRKLPISHHHLVEHRTPVFQRHVAPMPFGYPVVLTFQAVAQMRNRVSFPRRF